MDRCLIEAPHDDVDCHLLVEQVRSMGYLCNFDWGCEAGVHCGWAIVEADNEAQARLVVPSVVRDAARVIRLVKFSPDQAQELHRG